MRFAFHVAVIALLAYLITDRALLHAQGHEASATACSQGADRVEAMARAKGFGPLAARSQGEIYRSQCLVMGRL